jgi:hypothetical protein
MSSLRVAREARNVILKLAVRQFVDLLHRSETQLSTVDSMAAPTKPRLSVITSFNSKRDSISTRNVSNPFSLAIPGRYSKRSSRPMFVPLSIRPASSVYSQDQDEFLDKITPLKKVITPTERPVRPHPDNRQSKGLAAYNKHQTPYSREKRKFLATCWRINDRVLALSVTITLALFILVGVPLVAVMAQKFIVPLPVNVLVPSYRFPDPGAWSRLYDAYVPQN